MNKKAHLFLTTAMLSLISSASAASGYQTWTEQVTCGKATYKITSICKASGSAETLNECKSQYLEVTQESQKRKTKLPELDKHVSSVIKEVGGQLQNLFVVRQGCARIAGSSFEIFYYSIGGGSAPYSEAWAVYDSEGKLLEDKDPRSEKAADYPFERLKAVRSIMPDEK